MDDLLRKTGMDNKYKCIHLVIRRVRQLIKGREKMGLIGSSEKFTSIALREAREGKLKLGSSIEEKSS